MNILEKAFDIGFDKFLKEKYLKVNEGDFPLFLLKEIKLKTRFKPKQIPDRLLLSREKNICIEMKHNKGMSIPLSNIKQSQIDFMIKFEKLAGASYFIFSFNEMKDVLLIPINYYLNITNIIDKKSINIKDLEEARRINVLKKKVNIYLDIHFLQ